MPPIVIRPRGTIERVELTTEMFPSPLNDAGVDAVIRSKLPAQYQEAFINFFFHDPQGDDSPYFGWWSTEGGQVWCTGANFPEFYLRHGTMIAYPLLSDFIKSINQSTEYDDTGFAQPASIKFVYHSAPSPFKAHY